MADLAFYRHSTFGDIYGAARKLFGCRWVVALNQETQRLAVDLDQVYGVVVAIVAVVQRRNDGLRRVVDSDLSQCHAR